MNNLFSKQSKIYHSFKTEFNLNRIKNSDWQRDMLISLGVIESAEARKLTHKHAIVNIREANEVKHTETHHTIQL